MKYVRTKDGIYEIIYEEETFYKCKGNIFVSKDIFYHKNRVANTIEELCDELVLIRNDLHLNERTSNFEYAKRMAKQGFVVYGAIWTGKGLIYIAKMNGKGDLELL